jgi:hypothetical protein
LSIGVPEAVTKRDELVVDANNNLAVENARTRMKISNGPIIFVRLAEISL